MRGWGCASLSCRRVFWPPRALRWASYVLEQLSVAGRLQILHTVGFEGELVLADGDYGELAVTVGGRAG